MKKINKYSIVTILVVSFVLSLAGPIAALALTTAATPDLGDAATYGVLSDTYYNPLGPTTINGNVGFTTAPAVLPLGGHPSVTYPYYGSGIPEYTNAGAAQAAALAALNGGVNAACDFTFLAGAIDLSGNIQHGTIYTPGVYCIDGAMSIDTAPGITLNGVGTYIFRSTGALNTSADMTVTLAGGASACDVFWNPNGATTIGANNNFIGTVIPTLAAAHDITVYGGVATSWIGRALTFGHYVTTPTTNVTITVPTCASSAPPPAQQNTYNTITVIKQVINDSSGTSTYSDFPLFLNGNPVVSGYSQQLAPGIYTVTETNRPGYTSTFTGNCDATGKINHGWFNTQNDICTVVNDDMGVPPVAPVPPLIDVVKVPSPLALPSGPGSVTYTYTARNIGTVPMTDVTLVGDTCSPIVLASGDTNGDSKLDVNETWVYRCIKTISQTTINTVVATGHANGLTAIDVASARVVVGSPIVPPLIHITKVPDPLRLPFGLGMVIYTKKVTNPGTVALSNVTVTDDKCSPISYISGDTNGDSKLDPTETWTYTCRTNVTKTTTNTVTAKGSANGLIATDFALATVVVSVPKLPNTGLPPSEDNTPWNIIVSTGIFAILVSFYFDRRKQTA